MNPHDLQSIGNWVLYVTTALLVVLIVYYHLTATWWKSPEGRHVMAWTVCTAVIFAFLTSAISGSLSDSARLWVRIVVYGTFLWLGIWRFVLIASAQREARRRFVAGEHRRPPSEIPPVSMYPNAGHAHGDRRTLDVASGNDPRAADRDADTTD